MWTCFMTSEVPKSDWALIKTRPEVVNRCDSRFMTGFKTEFMTGHILMTVFMTELMMVFMTVIRWHS